MKEKEKEKELLDEKQEGCWKVGQTYLFHSHWKLIDLTDGRTTKSFKIYIHLWNKIKNHKQTNQKRTVKKFSQRIKKGRTRLEKKNKYP
jgi:hypothetical protein